jgi:putative NADH-flavin reductase
MKLVVLGATGRTGLEVDRQAVDLGHSVTAFVGSPIGMNSQPGDDDAPQD